MPHAPRLIAVIGTGRNGSTMLCRLLDGAGGLYAHLPECNFLASFNDLATRDWARQETIQNATRAPLRHLDGTVPVERLLRFHAHHADEIEAAGIAQTDLVPAGPLPRAALARTPAWRIEDFLPAFLAAHERWLFGAARAEALLFKSIETPYVGAYHDRFPTMHFVHLLRDPVETWGSSKRTLSLRKRLPEWYLGGDNLRCLIDRRWLPHAEWVARFADSPRHHLVRYEDLVRDPVAVVVDLCRRLGLAPPAEPDVQTVLGGRHPRSLAEFSSQSGVATPRAVEGDMRARYGYDAVVTERERAFIVLRTFEHGRRLGYFKGVARPDPGAVRRAWIAPDVWDFRNLRGPGAWLGAVPWYLRRRGYVWRAAGESAHALRSSESATDGRRQT